MNHPSVTLIDATAVLGELVSARKMFTRAGIAAEQENDPRKADIWFAKSAGVDHAISVIKIAQADAYATAASNGGIKGNEHKPA